MPLSEQRSLQEALHRMQNALSSRVSQTQRECNDILACSAPEDVEGVDDTDEDDVDNDNSPPASPHQGLYQPLRLHHTPNKRQHRDHLGDGGPAGQSRDIEDGGGMRVATGIFAGPTQDDDPDWAGLSMDLQALAQVLHPVE